MSEPLNPNYQPRQLSRYLYIRLGFFLALVLLALSVLFLVPNLLASFVFAVVIVYILGPIVNALERTGMERDYAVILVFLLASLIIGLAIFILSPFVADQFTTLQNDLPKYIEGTGQLIDTIQEKFTLAADFIGISNLSQHVQSTLESWAKSFFNSLPDFISHSVTITILAPFFAFFMIKDSRATFRDIMAAVPNNLFELFLNLYHQISYQLGQFVRARMLEGLCVGLIVWIGLTIGNFPYATLLAIFAALTNLIPYVGPILGAVPAFLVALINGHGSLGLIVVTAVYSLAQLIDMIFLIPLIVAKIVDLHPVTVVISIIIGAQLLGVLGMIISIPLTSALKVIVISLYRHLAGNSLS